MNVMNNVTISEGTGNGRGGGRKKKKSRENA